MIKAIILTGFGINCEEEMQAAYQLAGARADIVHWQDIFRGSLSIQSYDILNFPGGFSFGDDLGAAKVLANKIKYIRLPNGCTFLEEIEQFLQAKKYILGVCNGFQLLVSLGLLPNTAITLAQEASLIANDSGKFEARWVLCQVNRQSPSPFLEGIEQIALPVRHGEGKLIFKNAQIQQLVQDKQLHCLTYCDVHGQPTTSYPANPNGSALHAAALCDESGQILGIMPHPEAYLSLYNHPNWGQIKRQNPTVSEAGEGLQIFVNIVEHLRKL